MAQLKHDITGRMNRKLGRARKEQVKGLLMHFSLQHQERERATERFCFALLKHCVSQQCGFLPQLPFLSQLGFLMCVLAVSELLGALGSV